MKKRIVSIIVVFVFMVSASFNVVFADNSSNRAITVGAQNYQVLQLQNDLKKLGYYGATPTGYFGSITEQSVVYFQRDAGIDIDGIVGKETQREINVNKFIQKAKSYLGVPYVWGGVSPSGFDCSGFTHYALLENDIIVPRTAADQYKMGTWVPRSQLMPGDLVFFSTYKPGASHVGIYLGNNQFIQASSGRGQITISDLNKNYYSNHYLGAKRII